MRGNCGSGCPIPEEDKCLTESGDKCIFPFKFNDVTYYECTWDYSNTPWCSTEADPSGTNCIKIGLPGKLILSKRKGLWEIIFSRK